MADMFFEAGGAYIINGEKHFGRNIMITEDEIDDVRHRFNNTDVYVTAYMYDKKEDKDRLLYGPLYIDMDTNINSEMDYNRIKRDLSHVATALNIHYKVPFEQMRIYFSGHKGFHITVAPELFGVKPCKDLNEYYRFIATDLKSLTMFRTVDTQIYDNKRLFRLPNSINSKTGLYKVPVTLEFVKSSTYKDMIAYASENIEMDYPETKYKVEAAIKYHNAIERFLAETKKQERRNAVAFRKGMIPPCIQEMMDRGANEGHRNNTAVVLASTLMQTGKTLDETIDIVNTWNDEKNVPKLPERELRKTIQSAFKILQSGRRFGCRSVKEAGYCDGVECKLKPKGKK